MRKQIKKLSALVIIICIITSMTILSTSVVSAGSRPSYASGVTGRCTWTYEGKTKTLTISGNGEMGNYEAYGEGNWANDTPWGRQHLEIDKVVIENGVTTIGNYAFVHADMDSIEIANSVRSIGESAFRDNGQLRSIDIPNSVNSIGDFAFAYCTVLQHVTLPDNLSEIPNAAFLHCRKLQEVEIKSKVKTIWSSAFQECNIKSLSIPSNVTKIYSQAYYCNQNLRTVTIPASVTSIGEKAFGYYYVERYKKELKVDGFTIRGYKNTAAERYANANGFYFESLGTYTPSNPTARPAAPTLKASLSGNTITASWNKVANASKYIVYYKDNTKTDWSSTSTTSNSFKLNNVSSGRIYYIQVLSVGANNNAGHYSNVCSVNTTSKVNLQSLTYNGNNTLTWSGVSHASGYQIAELKKGDSSYTYYSTTATTFTHKNAVGGTAYTYQVRAKYGSVYGAWSKSKSVVTLVAPTLTLSVTANGITAKWNSIRGATKYTLFYMPAAASQWSQITTSGTSKAVTGLTLGKQYYFQVRPMGSYGYNGPYSSVKSATYNNIGTPTVTAAHSNGANKLSWKSVTGASRYQIAKLLSGEKSYTYISVNGTSYTDNNVTEGCGYYYQVRGLSGNGSAGSWSKAVYCAAMSKPVITKVEDMEETIKIEWDAVTGAESYELYYKNANEANWKKATVHSTSVEMNNPVSGDKYYFQVRPIGKNGATGPYSSVSSKYFVSVPKNLTVTDKGSYIRLSWNAVSGATKYRIAKWDDYSGQFEYFYVNGTSYSDYDVVSGRSYWYFVAAIKVDPETNKTSHGEWSDGEFIMKF